MPLFILAAGSFAALAVPYQRVGLALALVLVALVAVGAVVGPPGRERKMLTALGLALAAQPVLRDAGWVVALDAVAAVLCAGALATTAATWHAVARATVAPLRVVTGSALVARGLAALVPRSAVNWAPVARGLALAVVLTAVFGGLFVSADAAFAELAGDVFHPVIDEAALTWRAAIGLAVCLVAGALAAAAASREPAGPARRVPGAVELRIALGALVALFAAFIVVQLQVLFGGADHVRATTGLGLGEYARQGFAVLLVVVALTLGVTAVAARQRDRVVRTLLAALCGLCLVVLVSAGLRLDLVVDAYGLTRVRVTGEALVPWLAALLVLVLAAGAHPRIARRAPQIAVAGTLAAVLAFSLSNPDGRIAQRAVERDAVGNVDADYLSQLSADALPALRRLRGPSRAPVLAAVEGRLARPDGLAGFNFARAGSR